MSILDIFKKKEKFDMPAVTLAVPQSSFSRQTVDSSSPPPPAPSQESPTPSTQGLASMAPPIAKPPRSENFQAEDDVDAVLSSSSNVPSAVPLPDSEATNQTPQSEQLPPFENKVTTQPVTDPLPLENQQVNNSVPPDTFPEHAALPPEDFVHEAPSQRPAPSKIVSEKDHAQLQAMLSMPKPTPDIVAYPAPTGSGKIFEAIFIKKERYILLLQSLQENTKRLHAQLDDEQRLLHLQETIAQKLEKEESLLHNIFQNVMAMEFLTKR